MQHKIIFCGSVGAGKTTAIAAISDKQVVSTEAKASDEVKSKKATTTVAMDYGVLNLDGGARVHLYGTPGQQRFDYMWDILSTGGLGLVIWVDNTAEDPIGEMEFYIKSFKSFLKDKPFCVGVTRMDLGPRPRLGEYQEKLIELGRYAPVFEVDARSANDVKTLIRGLIHLIAVGV